MKIKISSAGLLPMVTSHSLSFTRDCVELLIENLAPRHPELSQYLLYILSLLDSNLIGAYNTINCAISRDGSPIDFWKSMEPFRTASTAHKHLVGCPNSYLLWSYVWILASAYPIVASALMQWTWVGQMHCLLGSWFDSQAKCIVQARPYLGQ